MFVNNSSYNCFRPKYKVFKFKILCSPLMARLVNDQITELERMFIDPFGLPQREDVRYA